ncbi:MAG: hypothetical protein J7604_25730 [Sporocytophaga sp.]|uniref:hypothetical protein n=1 Tax=Sporocytophaga sp. TaxID=2231183 RepID=UPI001B15FB81|nr:hypothetical protein [Sporocytophaga sp.]MBO9703631.1 hypothetical protein [Sporocytophaga sp.]
MLTKKVYYNTLFISRLIFLITLPIAVLLQSCQSEQEQQEEDLKQGSLIPIPAINQDDSLSEYNKTFFTNGKIRSACKTSSYVYDSLGKLIHPKCIYFDSLGKIIKQKDSLVLITDLTKEGLTFNKIPKTSRIDPYQMYYLQSMYPFLRPNQSEDNFYLSTDQKISFIFIIDDNWERKPYLIYKDSLFYEFPHSLTDGTLYTLEKVIGVSFQDINNDDLSDVTILKSGILGYGNIDFKYDDHYTCNIFLKKSDNSGFIYDSTASRQLDELPTLKEVFKKYKDVQK